MDLCFTTKSRQVYGLQLQAKLLHHPEVVLSVSRFYDLAFGNAAYHDLTMLEGLPGGGNAHKLARVCPSADKSEHNSVASAMTSSVHLFNNAAGNSLVLFC